MNRRISVRLSEDVLRQLGQVASNEASQSEYVDRVLRRHFRRNERLLQEEGDLQRINAAANRLNQESEDVLRYQARRRWTVHVLRSVSENCFFRAGNSIRRDDLVSFRSAVIAVGLLCVVACNDSLAEPKIESTTFASSLGVDLAASVKTPSGLYYRDITVGTGPAVLTGQRISVRYTGALRTGTVFDSNTTAATPFSFTLGAHQVIEGWDEGVLGMRVGGKRQLIIPPTVGYGPEDYGPIPGNSILVFTVEVISAT
jgi:hypothetical protein